MSASTSAFGQQEWDALVHALRGWGVRYFTGGHYGSKREGNKALCDPTVLLCCLAESPDPRLRQSIAALLLVHPELAPHALAAADRLALSVREQLIEAYVAAVYLQRLWRTRLRRHLGDQPELPPYWIEELGLPAAGDDFGRIGLACLGERSRRNHSGPGAHGGQPLGRVRRTAYEQIPSHLFAQFLAERAGARAA